MQIYSVQQMQALERASDSAGHSYAAMMEAAGSAVAQATERWIAGRMNEAKRVLVLAGPGNNGGDGLIAARELSKRGYSTVAYLWKRDEQDPLVSEARRHNVSLVRAENDAGDLLARALDRAEIVIDAIFGTGLSRPIEGEPARILNALRARRADGEQASTLRWISPRAGEEGARRTLALVAVDVPSGVHGDSGEVDEATVAADLTVTFAGPKVGMLTPDAVSFTGELVVADIGIPKAVTEVAESTARLLTPELAASLLPARPRGGHKGTFGTTMVVGGSINYIGAPALCAVAAGRSGAGLVTLAVPTILQPLLAPRPDLTTATWLLLPHDMGALRADATKLLNDALDKVDALVLGPGLGTDKATQHFVWSLFGLEAPDEPRASLGFATRTREFELQAWSAVRLPPMVVDADGLNILAQGGEWWTSVETPLVLTPHPGEMGRLLGRETGEVQAERLASAREAATRFKQVVVLKGAFTMVAAPDGRTSIAPFANDALAKAGSGDVLAGIIGALLGQGLEPYEATCLGVTAHGLAGTALARSTGGRGALASDLLDRLPEAWQQLEALRR